MFTFPYSGETFKPNNKNRKSFRAVLNNNTVINMLKILFQLIPGDYSI